MLSTFSEKRLIFLSCVYIFYLQMCSLWTSIHFPRVIEKELKNICTKYVAAYKFNDFYVICFNEKN